MRHQLFREVICKEFAFMFFKLANDPVFGQGEILLPDKRSFFRIGVRFALILERREKCVNQSIVSTIAFRCTGNK